jgi:hypothetical protein
MLNLNNKDGVFTGTIDQLFKHCANLDVEVIENQINERNRQKFLEYLMTESDCSEEEAQQIYNELNLKEVQMAIESLMVEGKVQVVGFNEDGEPLYGAVQSVVKPSKKKKKK